jgi:hypothetical protein
MPADVARRRTSLIELLMEYFDRHVEVLLREGVPPDRIAEALKLTIIRVIILHAGAIDEDLDAGMRNLRHPARPNRPEYGNE